MGHFAMEQVEQEHMDDNLAVLYEDMLDLGLVNEELAHCLARILFTRKLIVFDQKMVRAIIYQKQLKEPQIVKQAGGYAVRLRAVAKSIHMIRADIEAEVNPIVGSEAQSEELVRSIEASLGEAPEKIWDTNMFGKSLYELVSESLTSKLAHIPEDAQKRLSETLERVINEGSGGLICIIL